MFRTVQTCETPQANTRSAAMWPHSSQCLNTTSTFYKQILLPCEHTVNRVRTPQANTRSSAMWPHSSQCLNMANAFFHRSFVLWKRILARRVRTTSKYALSFAFSRILVRRVSTTSKYALSFALSRILVRRVSRSCSCNAAF